MFKELKETMKKELKNSMRTILNQIKNINEIETIKKNQ